VGEVERVRAASPRYARLERFLAIASRSVLSAGMQLHSDEPSRTGAER
jgi:hypothetical protein